MALANHIPLGNDMVDHLRGPAPAFAFSYGLDLCPRGLDPMIPNEHTPEVHLCRGLAPSLFIGHGQDIHLGGLRPMAHGELAASLPEEWPMVAASF